MLHASLSKAPQQARNSSECCPGVALGSNEQHKKAYKSVKLTKNDGGRDWDRTSDPCDVNAVLVPLSYAPASNQKWRNFYIGWRTVKATRA
jgi:hypothetical protein